MRGQITKISSDLHVVNANDINYSCKCRGIFRYNKITPVVGDYVIFDSEKLQIEKIEDRKNIFVRPKVANIDQAFIVTSLVEPNFSLNLLDKLISVMEINNVEAIICITKSDITNNLELNRINEILNYYKQIGYKVIFNNDIETIKELLKNKISVFTGQTGAGKSTLINNLMPNLNLATGEISLALGRGKHTTRTVELFDLYGGKVVDTPGFSSLNFLENTNDEIKNSFIEFGKYNCKYRGCNHIKEEGCEVIKAVNDNNILESRYLNYLKFIEREK